jgi:hypothetical protein
MSEQQIDEAPPVTVVEGATWTVALAAVLAYIIAFFVAKDASVDDMVPAGWLTAAGMIAGVTLAPAIILSGIRHLVPALRR